MSEYSASDKQQSLCLTQTGSGDEMLAGLVAADTPVNNMPQKESVVDRFNWFNARYKARSNQGGAGIDGMTVDDLPAFLKQH